jgi:hypothetical protein
MNIDPSGKISFLDVIQAVGIISIVVSLLIPVVKMGKAARNLINLSEIAGMIRNSPLDMITKLLLRNQITLLAIQNLAKLFSAFAELIQEVLVTVVIMVLTTLIIKAIFATVGSVIKGISHSAIRVAQGVGSYGDDTMRLKRIICKGEKIVDIVDEVKSLTYQTGKEHAVVKLADGSRAIVSGGRGSIRFPAGSIQRIFGHSHVYDKLTTGPSSVDIGALEKLGQATSYLLEHGELYKFTALAGG